MLIGTLGEMESLQEKLSLDLFGDLHEISFLLITVVVCSLQDGTDH